MAELRLKSTGTIKLFENDDTSSVTIASPASLGADRTVTLPDASVTLASGTMLATDGSGASLTALNASELGSGTVPTARLGSGTASSSTVLYGDQTYKTEPGFSVTSITDQTALDETPADTDEFVLSDAGTLKRMDYDYIKGVHKNAWAVRGTTTTNFTNNVEAVVPLDSERFDPDGLFDHTGTYKWVCPADGTYFFYGQLIFASLNNTTGCIEVNLKCIKNGGAWNSIGDGNRNWASLLGEDHIYYNTVESHFSHTFVAGDYAIWTLTPSGANPISGTFVNYGSSFGGWRLF